MKSKIFAYKGIVGAETDLENGVFANNPKAEGQIGCVIPIEEIEITQEAIDLIKKAPRESGSFASIMLMDNHIGLLGFHKHVFQGEKLCISRDCKLSTLDKLTVVDYIPEDFKQFVDYVTQFEDEEDC
jgi:hypothetical protein